MDELVCPTTAMTACGGIEDTAKGHTIDGDSLPGGDDVPTVEWRPVLLRSVSASFHPFTPVRRGGEGDELGSLLADR